jgi:prepilin-type processing-associated H-X9-DG protein
MSGPFQCGTSLRFADLTDGLSNTLLMGEKHVPQDRHGQGWWDCSINNGDYNSCFTRAGGRLHPLTTNPKDTGWKFGSRHTGAVLFFFADGHVQSLPESIDPYTLELLTSRNDGLVVPEW